MSELWSGVSGLWSGFSGLSGSPGFSRGGGLSPYARFLYLNFLSNPSLDPRVTFSRTTNATLVDNTGRVTYAPNNQCLYSEQFDTTPTWATTSSTAGSIIVPTSATTAPNGTFTAYKHIPNVGALMGTGGAETRVLQDISSTIGVNYIFSIYAKAGECNQIQIALITTPSVGALFSLTSGTVVSGTGASITPAGDGWYRCAFPVTSGATGDLEVRFSAKNNPALAGDGTSGIYVWGAQFEAVTYQTVPSAYNRTVASAYYGPRFDYDPATLAPLGLLIEEQRANLLLRSEELSNVSWSKTRSSVTADATTSPDGKTNADRFVIDATASTNHSVGQSISVTSGTTYAFTVFAKADQFSQINLRFSAQFPAGNVYYDLNNGAVDPNGAIVSASMASFGNGWWRCVLVMTASTTGTSAPQIFLAQSNSITIATADNTSGLFLYGAQFEVGAFATSYIPTVAVVPVPRDPDIAVMTGTNFSSWYNQSEGTMVAFYDTTTAVVPTPLGAFSVSDATTSERMQIRRNSANTNAATIVVDGGTPQYNQQVVAGSGPYRAALAYANSDFRGVNNGTLATAGTSGTVPTVTQAEIGFGQSLTYLNGHLSSITYYPQRLPDAQLQELTALPLNPSLSLDFLAGAPLDSRITFSRTTNATLIDSTGLMTYAPNNQVTYSQEPSNAAWGKTRASIIANVMTAPDGTLTGSKLVEDTSATNTHRTSVPTISMTSGTSYTFSIFLKAGERTFAVVSLSATSAGSAFGSNPVLFVDLLTGAISSVSGTVTAYSVVAFPDGWWRVSVSATATLTTSNSPTVFLAVSGSSNSYSGDGTSGLFLWGAQFEQVTYQTLPSTYVQTVASAYYGPRFDYDPVTLAPLGLLIEEERTNLVLQSQNFSDAAWIPVRATSTANATTSPDGRANADILTGDGTSGNRNVSQNVTYTAAAHTISVYAKKDTNDFVQLRFATAAIAGGTGFANFDLNAGTVGTIGAGLSAASITPAGNGWYRCTITGTTVAVASNLAIYIVTSASASSAQSNTLATSIFLYGAQLEAGAFATSYIPTGSLTVPRNADIATMTGTNFSSWYNASEGAFVSSFEASPNPYTTYVAASDGVVAQNSIHMDNDIGGTMRVPYYSGSTPSAILSLGAIGTIGAVNTIATAYKVNNFAASRNGAAVVTDLAGAVPVGVVQLNIGADPSGAAANVSNTHIRNITYYPTRLTNAQLQELSV